MGAVPSWRMAAAATSGRIDGVTAVADVTVSVTAGNTVPASQPQAAPCGPGPNPDAAPTSFATLDLMSAHGRSSRILRRIRHRMIVQMLRAGAAGSAAGTIGQAGRQEPQQTTHALDTGAGAEAGGEGVTGVQGSSKRWQLGVAEATAARSKADPLARAATAVNSVVQRAPVPGQQAPAAGVRKWGSGRTLLGNSSLRRAVPRGCVGEPATGARPPAARVDDESRAALVGTVQLMVQEAEQHLKALLSQQAEVDEMGAATDAALRASDLNS